MCYHVEHKGTTWYWALLSRWVSSTSHRSPKIGFSRSLSTRNTRGPRSALNEHPSALRQNGYDQLQNPDSTVYYDIWTISNGFTGIPHSLVTIPKVTIHKAAKATRWLVSCLRGWSASTHPRIILWVDSTHWVTVALPILLGGIYYMKRADLNVTLSAKATSTRWVCSYPCPLCSAKSDA